MLVTLICGREQTTRVQWEMYIIKSIWGWVGHTLINQHNKAWFDVDHSMQLGAVLRLVWPIN